MKHYWQFLSKWQGPTKSARKVLGMNLRNLHYIYPYNHRRDFPLADDKLKTKMLMKEAGAPIPNTYRVYRHFYELGQIESDLSPHRDFVIKPSKGRAGNGIVVITSRNGDGWLDAGGRSHTAHALRKHISDIIFSVFSFGIEDVAIVEERIVQHADINKLSPLGMADIRMIMFQNKPELAMIRIPTRESEGKANLHKGAVGIGINLSTGRTTKAVHKGQTLDRHPDTDRPLLGWHIPHWNKVVSISGIAARVLPLKYVGIDIAVTPRGPVILEVNVRPGLEIQNANSSGLRRILESTAHHGELLP